MMTTNSNILSAVGMRVLESTASIGGSIRARWTRLRFAVECKARAIHTAAIRRAITRFASEPMTVTAAPTLIIAPHQDDETLGCGGLIAMKRKLGAQVTVIFITDGGNAPVGDERLTSNRLVPMREREASIALRALDIAEDNVCFLGHPDGKLAALPLEHQREVEWQIAELIRATNATEIFVPHRADAHSDHEAAFAFTQRAIKIANASVNAYQYLIWMTWLSPLFWRLSVKELKGALRLDTESVMGKKCGAIGAYATQVSLFPPGFLTQFLRKHELYFPVLGESESNVTPVAAEPPQKDVA